MIPNQTEAQISQSISECSTDVLSAVHNDINMSDDSIQSGDYKQQIVSIIKNKPNLLTTEIKMEKNMVCTGLDLQ